MMKISYSSCLAIGLILFFSQCQPSNQRDANRPGTIEKVTNQDTSLVAVLKMDTVAKLHDSLFVVFSVYNPTKDTLRFTQYHTPFEGFISNFLTITDNEGVEASYSGAMAKRIMPPPEETFCVVAPGEQDSVRFSIKQGYRIEKPGIYTIQYNAGNISGMDNGASIRVRLEE